MLNPKNSFGVVTLATDCADSPGATSVAASRSPDAQRPGRRFGVTARSARGTTGTFTRMTGPWFSGVRGKVGKIAGARRRTSRWDDWRADALAYLPLAWRAPRAICGRDCAASSTQ